MEEGADTALSQANALGKTSLSVGVDVLLKDFYVSRALGEGWHRKLPSTEAPMVPKGLVQQ